MTGVISVADLPAPTWRTMRPVMKCLNCGHPVCQRFERIFGRHSAFGAPVWWHWGFWQGRRCPNRLTGAEPGEEFGSEDEYWTWVDQQIQARRSSGD